MENEIISRIIDIFGNETGKTIGVIFVSVLPMLGLRAAVPIAFAFGFNWWTAFIYAVVGSIFPVPFILFFLESIFNFMQKHNIFGNSVEKMRKKAAARSEKISRYRFWGMMIFVAIPLPLPGTGGWTASLIASVMKMNKKNAFMAIFLGTFLATIIVTIITYGLVGYFIK